MGLPPLPSDLGAGWTIDDDDPRSIYVHPDSALPYLAEALELDAPAHADALLDYVAAHAPAVLATPAFLTAPQRVLAAVLAHPTLSVAEDVLLAAVLRYIAAQTRVPLTADSARLLSSPERAAAAPLTAALLPQLALLSLSTHAFLNVVEPLADLSTRALTAKYRYDALRAEYAAAGRTEREMVRDMYGGSAALARPAAEGERGMPWARRAAAVSESPHPYEAGGGEERALVRVAAWAGRVLVEFDRRCAVADDARLRFYGGDGGDVLLADWAELWRGGGARAGGRRFVVFPGNMFWVAFECPALSKRPLWGWKLRAQPLLDIEGEEVVA